VHIIESVAILITLPWAYCDMVIWSILLCYDDVKFVVMYIHMDWMIMFVVGILAILRGWSTCANGETLAYVHVVGCDFCTTQSVDLVFHVMQSWAGHMRA
jgi:hypothetical protein